MNFPRGTRGGGIGILHKSHLKLENRTFQETFEYALISNSSCTLNFVVVYRPDPSGVNTSPFLSEFEEFFSNVDLLSGRTLVLGDFNIHCDLPSKPEVKQFCTILSSMGYRQLVDVPMHRLLRTLDLLIVKDNETLVSEWDINPTYYSDHLIINCVLDVTRVMISKTFRVSRNFKAIDHQIFATDLAEKINSVLEQGHINVNDLVKGYNNACLNVLDTHAPVKSKPRSVRYKPKWYNDNVIKARRERRRYERRWRKTGLDADYQIYIDAKSTAADVIVREKSNFYKNKFADCTCSYKDIYKTVNEPLNVSGNVLPDSDTSAELANNFCEYFVGKVNKIRCELDMYDPCSSNSTTSHENQSVVSCIENQSVVSCNLFDFQLITEDDLCKIIAKCPTKSCPLDPMPTWLVKQHLETLAPILTAIVNVSLSSGVFPAELSKAVITPVLKKPSLDRNLLSNYRRSQICRLWANLLRKWFLLRSPITSMSMSCRIRTSQPTKFLTVPRLRLPVSRMTFLGLLTTSVPFYF
ncbi:uncharacterized protein [Amphiura filiformis]|uniref:uncharacterized protein n=1 Tax=Amphiura filiformis TaxID=82378 RepID=UPI003B21B986